MLIYQRFKGAAGGGGIAVENLMNFWGLFSFIISSIGHLSIGRFGMGGMCDAIPNPPWGFPILLCDAHFT